MSTRDKLLEAAARMFAEHGYDGTSVRDIIKEADANLGAVTYHFGTKEALFSESLGQKLGPLLELGKRIEESQASAMEKLDMVLRGYAMFVLHENPNLKAMFMESMQGGDRLPPGSVQMIQWRNKVIGDIVKQGINEGVFRKCNTKELGMMILGLISPYVQDLPIIKPKYRNTPVPKREVNRIIDAAMDMILNGLKVRGEGK